MPESTWKTTITEELLTELGFTPAKPEDQKSDEYEEIATVSIPVSYSYARLRAYKSDPDYIYFVFSDDKEGLGWLKLQIEPTEEALRQVYNYYIKPAIDFAKPREGQNMLVQVAALREATGRVSLTGDDVQKCLWMIGVFDYEDGMVGLENALTMSSFTDSAGIRQATGSGDIFTQFSSSLSGSLITIIRQKIGPTNGFFMCEIQYHPSFHAAYTEKLLKEHKQYSPDLPADIPLDIVGLFETLQFSSLTTAEQLLESANAGDHHSVLSLAVMTQNDTFDEVFLPLASHESEAVRNEVAYEAVFRENKKIYDAAAAKGISDEAKAHAEKVWLKPDSKETTT